MPAAPLATTGRLSETAKKAAAVLSDVSSKTFDYVIVGGGTAGMTLASRLAEDRDVTIAVLEAGGDMHTHDSILMPAQYGREHGNPELCYPHETVVQTSVGRSFPWARGRGIGGSSAVNFMIFQKPPTIDIDAWEKLGSPGWDWAHYDAAIKKTEAFHSPPADDVERFHLEYNAASFGKDGPVHTSYTKIMTAGERNVKEAFLNLGVRATPDPAGGDIRGIGTFPNSIDPRTNTRSFAAIGYFLEGPDRLNLKVLAGATVQKVVFIESADTSGGDDLIEADGVEFEYQGEVHVVRAKREVILSAGTLRSSSLLELSGIGNRCILEPLGIETKVHNPSVGENIQEHCISSVTWEIDQEKYGFETIDLFSDPAVVEKSVQQYIEGRGLFLTHINYIGWLPLSDISSPERTAELIAAEEARIALDLASCNPRPGLREQYDLQLEMLKDPEAVDTEFILVPFYFPSPTANPQPGKTYASICCGLNHPFSRGCIHVSSADPEAAARMDPRVFNHEFDADIMVEMYKYCRKVAATAPFKDIIVQEVNPGPAVETDEEIKAAMKATVGSTWHTIGTCAMSPRDKGGVVDPSLKVYGTKNLRVCDLSIIPLHIAAHTQTAAYSIGEQLADILKSEVA